ncbi:MAG: hypothetical protein GDA38_02910 [Hormoscilla sp. SP12CHS1]|nr:hypothetical protein [Hormoscilla sp. SP12CHS1]
MGRSGTGVFGGGAIALSVHRYNYRLCKGRSLAVILETGAIALPIAGGRCPP